VRAIADLSLEKRAEGIIFNIGNDQPITIKGLALKVKKRLCSKSKIVLIPYTKAYGKHSADFEDISYRIPDISRIKKLVNFEPLHNIDNIIDDTAAYFLKKRREKS